MNPINPIYTPSWQRLSQEDPIWISITKAMVAAVEGHSGERTSYVGDTQGLPGSAGPKIISRFMEYHGIFPLD